MDKVNFTAKMDISSIKNNTNRWVNIAKTFEKHTREYPFDTFKVSETQNGIDILNINSKTKQDALVNFEKENLKELLSITDIAIVQRFKNLLSLFEKRDKCYEKTQKYLAILKSICNFQIILKSRLKKADLHFKISTAYNNFYYLKLIHYISLLVLWREY